MANPPPNDLNANLPEDKPVQPEHVPAMLGFAPAMLNIPNNNNGSIEEDDEEEIEAEEDDEEEMEAEEDDEEEMEAKDDNEMDATDLPPLSLILPYVEFIPLGNDPNTIHFRVRSLTKQMWDRLRAAKEKSKDKYIDVEYFKYRLARVSRLYDDLSIWQSKIRDQLPPKKDAAAVVPTREDDENPAVPSDP
nr:hypothetical protein [Tanacetum cinerariifolium]